MLHNETPEEYQARVASDEWYEEYLLNRTEAQARRDRIGGTLRGVANMRPADRAVALRPIYDLLAKLETEDQKDEDFAREAIYNAIGDDKLIRGVHFNADCWDEETAATYISMNAPESPEAKSAIDYVMSELDKKHERVFFEWYKINWREAYPDEEDDSPADA